MKTLLILFLAIIFNAFANISIKAGMTARGAKEGTEGTLFDHVLAMAVNPHILAGLVLFGLALVSYSWVLGRMNLSIAYPVMTSLGFLIVILFSWLFFKETISAVQLAGSALIIIGVWMVAQGIR